MGVAHQGQVRGVPLVAASLGLSVSLGQIVGGFRRGQQAVRQPGQHRKLIAPGRAAPRRHHGGGVPPQHGRRLANRGNTGEAVGQAGICGHDGAFKTLRAYAPNMTSSTPAMPNQVTA